MPCTRKSLEQANDYFTKFIQCSEQEEDYQKRGLMRKVDSSAWEYFAALLTDDYGSHGGCTDLIQAEVKSSLIGGSFMYQYHRNRNSVKYKAESKAWHIYIQYSKGYTNARVYMVSPESFVKMRKTIPNWTIENVKNCWQSKDRQRCQHNVPYERVVQFSTATLYFPSNGNKEALEKLGNMRNPEPHGLFRYVKRNTPKEHRSVKKS